MGLNDRLFKRASQTIESHVWIGLDFGTATTECVVRVETRGEQDRIFALACAGDNRSTAQVVIPSAVEEHGVELLTGVHLRGRGHVYENLKLELIREVLEGKASGELRRLGGPFARSVLHVASVLSIARCATQSLFRDRKLAYYINIGAPLGPDASDPAHRRLQVVFQDLAHRASLLSETAPCRPLTKAEAQQLLQTVLNGRECDAATSPITVVPEALAAVTAFLHLPGRPAGNYATIDIGGGSTDFSFFWFQPADISSNGQAKAWYYAIRTELVGTHLLLDALASLCSEHRGRTRHERLKFIPSLEPHRERPQVRDFLERVAHGYRRCFGTSFEVRQDFRDWCLHGVARWELLLLGGGCADEVVQRDLRARTPNAVIKGHPSVRFLKAPASLDVVLPDGVLLRPLRGQTDVLQTDGHLVTVAYGLSHRAPDIPEYGKEEPKPPRPLPPPWEPHESTEAWTSN